MTPNRRTVLKFALAAGMAPLMGRPALAENRPYAPAAGDWHRFTLETAVTLPGGRGPAQVWLPVPAVEGAWQRSLGHEWTGNAQTAGIVADAGGAQFLHATFDGSAAPALVLTSTVETRNRTVDWSRTAEATEDPAVLAAALAPSGTKPLHGVVAETAARITAGLDSDIGKVRAIYDWIVANCHRDMDVRGCGTGDTEALLTTANRGGKCADLNGLFVALSRAAGVPARDLFGVRVAPSEFGYRQLGANAGVVTGAQHCRAEVFLAGHGWVAMDPADVLKVMRAETGTWIRDPADPLVAGVNAALLGNWEGNWVAFNSAEDLRLPGRAGVLPFMMYPQAEVGGAAVDELDAADFAYVMTAQPA